MALKVMLLLLSLLIVLQILVIPTCNCQTQNIETFYPSETTEPTPTTELPEPTQPPRAQASAPSQGPVGASKSSSSNSKVAKAVAATAASTLVVFGLVLLLVRRCFRARRRKEIETNINASVGDRRVVPQGNVFEKIDGNIKGLVVDEDGLDVIYWRKLQEDKNSNKDLPKEVFSAKNKEDDYHEGNQGEKSKSIQETPLLREQSSTSHMNIFPEESYTIMRISPPAPPPNIPALVDAGIRDVEKPDSTTSPFAPPLPPSPKTSPFAPPPLSSPKPPSIFLSSIPKVTSPTPPHPSTTSDRKNAVLAAAPPPPPPMPHKKNSPTPPLHPPMKSQAPPPPPPQIPTRKNPAPPPPPPPNAGGSKSSSKPPPTPIEKSVTNSKRRKSSGEDIPETGNGQVKLKPLHWDKVNTNLDHSMVWDKIDRGSFRVDDDLMEVLFGYATNRNIPKGNYSTSTSRDAKAPSTKVFILDPKKSQNIAIVLKSLAISQKQIIDALFDGQGLDTDTIEKLARVAPTEEEQSHILEYNGDPATLATAECFLYHILKAVPSAFKRLNAMLFRLNYDSEIQEIKEILQTLEFGCKELRNQGVFVKLLEAVLKAGNRMNAGTHRGNAQAFNLASLRKLSDVKSIDGKTTLLHFVVEEVVRTEGKRAVLNRNISLSHSSSSSNSWISNSSGSSENSAVSNEQIQREYVTIGLPIVGGVSSEFSNVKKAALTDYNSFVGSISMLAARIVEIRELVSHCGSDERGNFVREMNHFLENAEEELTSVREEQSRIMQLVKRTTSYYQGGASKDSAEHPLYLFVIVKDFLGMVDQACIEIARNMQKRRTPKAS